MRLGYIKHKYPIIFQILNTFYYKKKKEINEHNFLDIKVANYNCFKS